jgi:hypothetical protein
MGISLGINRIRSNEKMVPNDGDFLFEHKESLLLPPSLGLPQGVAVQWKDYCPFVFRCVTACNAFQKPRDPPFRHLRQELGVDPGQFLSGVCGGNMNISPTAGRSGAQFIVPDGGRFFLKSLTKGESKTLRSVLKSYHA